jgi:transposase
VEKTSRNSSKPPSSDGPKKGATEPRRRGQKPNGGQPGHPGVTRVMVDEPDVVVELRPEGHCGCGLGLDGQEGVLKERRQQIEIPEPKTVVSEYRQIEVRCACGAKHCGAFPPGVTPNVSYGPRLKAYAVGLVDGHFVALGRTAEIIGDQYGVQPSDGTIQTWTAQAAARLAAEHAALGAAVAQADVACFDESGMRVNGKLHWLPVATTATAVHYTVHAKRGQEAMDAAGVLPSFQGVAVHDHWKPYWRYGGAAHALRNARELRYCEEATGHFWPVALRRLLVEGKKTVTLAQACGKEALDSAQMDDLLARYDEHVAAGLEACPPKPPEPGRKGRAKQDFATNLLLRLRDYKTETLRFLADWRVPFDNNAAERKVRPVKVKLKVIGGFRAVGGAEAFCVIRSVWETSKLNNLNPFETLRLAFMA